MNIPHTPGPWRREGNFVYASTPYLGKYSGFETCNRFSARIQSDNRIAVGGAPDEEIEANARLIAAAPTLLEVLQLIHSNAAESPEWIRVQIDKATSTL